MWPGSSGDVITQLGGRYPRLPPFATKVFVKKRSWKLIKEEFVEKVVAARILCPSAEVARGFLVKTEDGSYLTTMVAVENVKEFSGEFEVDAAPTPTAVTRGSTPGSREDRNGYRKVSGTKGRVSWILRQRSTSCRTRSWGRCSWRTADFSPQAVDELLDGLWLSEMMVPNRRSKVFLDHPMLSAHVAGMFRHGGVVGATNLARQRPALTKFLVAAMKAQMPPGTSFTTIALNSNTPMRCHKDSNNRPGEKAFLMGFGNYVGGGLWCHEDNVRQSVAWKQFQGQWLPGRTYNTYHNLVCFDPCRFHQPQQWEGKRITISAYTVNCYDNCSQAHRALLQALGFPLPHDCVRARPEGGEGAYEDVLVSGGTKSLRRPKGALRVLCSGFF